VEVVDSLSQGRTAAAQCGLFTHKSVPVIFEPPCTIFLHQYALSSSFSLGKTYSYSAGIIKRAKGTRPWEKGKSMPVVTLVIRWSFGTNYAPNLRMEAVKAPDMSEHLCQTMGRRILEHRNPLRKEWKFICNRNFRLKSLFLRLFKFSQMR